MCFEQNQALSQQLLAWLNKNKRTFVCKSTQAIDMMSPITRSELTLPVRNTGCLQKKRCVWPLLELIEEVKTNYDSQCYKAKEEGTCLVKTETYVCKMCHEESKLSDRRNFSDFYQDYSLNCTIRIAKQRFIDYFGGTGSLSQNQQLKKQAYKHFKHSKLIIHPTGTVQLQFNSQLKSITPNTIILVMNQDKTSNLSPQLAFNPKDYLTNLSALKTAQNLVYQQIGAQFDKTITAKLPKYTQRAKQLLNIELQRIIGQSLEGKVHLKPNEAGYAVKIVLDQSRKSAELMVFDPGSNLTTVYSLNQKCDIAESALNKQLKILKLKQALLLNTLNQTFMIRFSFQDRIQYMKIQHLKLKRNFRILSQGGDIDNYQTNSEVEYLKHYPYSDFPEVVCKCEWIEPDLIDYCLLVDPNNQEGIYVIGGRINNQINANIYKLEKQQTVHSQQLKYAWKIQKQQLKIGNSHFLIAENKQIFIIQGMQRKNINLIQLQFQQNTLKIVSQKQLTLQKPLPKGQYVPIKSKHNQYYLIDLYKRYPIFELDIKQKAIRQLQRQIQITHILKDIGYSKYSTSNSFDHCLNQVQQNQVNYLLLESHKNIHIVYGCGDTWLTSNILQNLVKQ